MLSSRFLAVAIGFVLINAGLAFYLAPGASSLCKRTFDEKNYTSPMYGTWTWWMARSFVLRDERPDVVLIGSSQMTSACWAADATLLQESVDCLTHRDSVALSRALAAQPGFPKNLKVADCAVGGGMASDYYMVARTLFTPEKAPSLVVVGVSPRDFIDNKLPAASATEPFRFFSRFIDAGKLSSLAYPDPYARVQSSLQWQLSSLPLRRLNEMLDTWASSGGAGAVGITGSARPVAPGNELMAAISNAHKQVRIGEWVVPANMQPIFVDNSQEYVKRYQNPNPASLPVQYAFFDELLKTLRETGTTVLVVEMPTTPSNRSLLPDGFWREYHQNLRSACSTNGAHYVDLSDSPEFVKADYVDTVHLNDHGGLKFFRRLAAVIAGDRAITASLTGPARISNRGLTNRAQ